MALGIERVDLICFDADFSRISAEGFLHDILIPKYDPAVIVVGHDSHFGHLRKGDHAFLQSHQEQYRYRLEYVEPCLHEGVPISSSMIRKLLLDGKLDLANTLLGSPYTLYGEVVAGQGLGNGLGFPTANLCLADQHQLVPHPGIYLSRAVLNGSPFFGLTNIGTSPTLKRKDKIETETYLMNFKGDLYGKSMEVELLRFLREEKKFEGREALRQAMLDDLARAELIIPEILQ
jgi:riboflavin kinase/FMN adenylyltransferase